MYNTWHAHACYLWLLHASQSSRIDFESFLLLISALARVLSTHSAPSSGTQPVLGCVLRTMGAGCQGGGGYWVLGGIATKPKAELANKKGKCERASEIWRDFALITLCNGKLNRRISLWLTWIFQFWAHSKQNKSMRGRRRRSKYK